MNSLVSIITPAYNVEGFIAETIMSVIGQTYTNWELIIIDDCSTDNSFEISLDFSRNDPRIKAIRMSQNGGAAAARNMGIRTAKGNFIAFLDSDDLWQKEKLEIQVQVMKQKDLAFSYGAYNVITESGDFFKTIHVPVHIDYKELLKGCDVGCLTAMYSVDKLGKRFFLEPGEGNRPQLPEKVLRRWGREDYVLWLEIAKDCPNESIMGINQVLANYRRREGGISANKWKSAKYQWMVYRDVEKLNIFSAAYYFVLYTINGIRKHSA